MGSHQQRLSSLLSVSENLDQYLTSLCPDAWGQPSACSLWKVADVVAHLVSGAESYIGSVSRGLLGDTSAPPGRTPAGLGAAVTSAERIASGAIAIRQRLGDELLTAFEATSGQLNALLAGLNPCDRHRPCYHSGSIVPAANFIDLRLNELTVHDWDIRSVLDPQARLASEGLPSTLLMFSQSLAAGSVRWAFWPGPKLATPVRYRFEVPGPILVRADILVQGDQVGLEEPGEAAANATFHCDTETFVRLMYGRISPAAAIGLGRLAVDGDRQRADQFNQWFRGI